MWRKAESEVNHLTVLHRHNAAKVTVTLFHDIIKNLLISQGKHGLPINEDNVTSIFLKLLALSSSRKAVAKTGKLSNKTNTCSTLAETVRQKL